MDDGLRPHRTHTTWPGIVRIALPDDALRLYNAGHGTSLDVEADTRALVEQVLAAFAEPRSLASFFRAEAEVPRALVVLLVRSGFVVEDDELPFLEHGFLRPTPSPVGAALAWSDLPELAVPGAWVVLGVPSDAGAAGQGGARHGPREIRSVLNGQLLSGEGDVVDYDLARLYRSPVIQVADLGDVEPDGGRLDHVGARLAKAAREVLQFGMRPLVLGGDHSFTHFVLGEAIARGERFGILHFDAHADMGPSRTLSHANVFAAALSSPCVERIVQIGLRGIERMSPFARATPSPKRSVITAREARSGGALAALAALPTDIPYYLTFDIDCIDAALAPQTGAALFGGLDVALATELVDFIARHFQLLGADFVEVSGPPSALNGAAVIAASLLQRLLLAASPFEPLPSDVYVI